MATGQTLINRALRLLGQIAAGASPTSAESDDALTACNAMLDSWRNERLMCYSVQEESLTLASGDSTYTLGPAGDLVTTRPVEIIAAWVEVDGTSYPVEIISTDEYAAIPVKATEADWPDKLLYLPTMATGQVIVYPVPNATRTLKLHTRVPVAALTLVGTVSLPPGWEEAIASNLAIALAPEFETEPRQSVIKMARESKAAIKTINSRPIKAYSELSQLVGTRHANIQTDQ